MLAEDPMAHRMPRVPLAILFVAALGLRFGAAMVQGDEHGYQYYVEMARHLESEGRLYRTMPFGQGDRFALRTPGYPLVLAALDEAPGPLHAKVALFGAACGALSVVLAAVVATRLFGVRAGLAAGAGLALWPHAVLHDGALQDTALYTTLFLALVLASHEFLRLAGGGAGDMADRARWRLVARAAGAGLLGAAAVLVRVALLPTAVALLLWPLLGRGSLRHRVALVATALVALNVGLLPWRLRNARVVGRAVLTSDVGRSLWLGNNPQLFDVYPRQSIDRAEELAWTALPEETRARVRGLGTDELAQDAWFREQALAWIRANPRAALIGAARKAGATFSPWWSPAGSPVKQWVHLLSYGPVALLALGALVRARVRWRETLPIFVCCILLAVQSGVFFGHSAYRAYLDPLLLILAASWLVPRARLDASPATAP